MTAASEPFSPEEFLRLAVLLVGKDIVTEAESRTAMGRAYYAIHLRAREQLVTAGLMAPTGSAGEHRAVASAIRRANVARGNQVDMLRAERNAADYDLQRRVEPDHARRLVELAESLWDRL